MYGVPSIRMEARWCRGNVSAVNPRRRLGHPVPNEPPHCSTARVHPTVPNDHRLSPCTPFLATRSGVAQCPTPKVAPRPKPALSPSSALHIDAFVGGQCSMPMSTTSPRGMVRCRTNAISRSRNGFGWQCGHRAAGQTETRSVPPNQVDPPPSRWFSPGSATMSKISKASGIDRWVPAHLSTVDPRGRLLQPPSMMLPVKIRTIGQRFSGQQGLEKTVAFARTGKVDQIQDRVVQVVPTTTVSSELPS